VVPQTANCVRVRARIYSENCRHGLREGQSGQRQRRYVGCLVNRPAPGTCAFRALRTGCEHYQQAVTVSAVNQPVQRLDRLLIGLLQIIDQDQHRTGGAKRINQIAQALGRD
jgi:hypothetical protein